MKRFTQKAQLRLLVILFMTLFLSIGCALIPPTTIYTTITSEPPGADIYVGTSKDALILDTTIKTPATITFAGVGAYWKAAYYQVKKEGYEDSEIIFKDKENGTRTLYFQLIPKMVITPVPDESINVTSTSSSPDINSDPTFPQNKGRNLIKGIQISLQGLGYQVENINGELNLSTISLIKKFQSEHNLVVDGIPTTELLNFSFSLRKESKLSNIGCSQRKNCSELTSCEEALYYLNVCGDGRLDHNNSGIPCEASVCSYSNRIARPTSVPTPTPTPVPTLNSSPSLNTNKPVEVKGYYRKDGTYVRPHTRNAPRKK